MQMTRGKIKVIEGYSDAKRIKDEIMSGKRNKHLIESARRQLQD
jgi:hypothetical protein